MRDLHSRRAIRATQLTLLLLICGLLAISASADDSAIGREVSVPDRLEDGQEFELDTMELFARGEQLFNAAWTDQEGGGRPLSTGTGAPISDPDRPLEFPENFNRISGPDANSCGGCHNLPGSGGGGDIVTNVFVLGQRFDRVTLDPEDFDERGERNTLNSVANSRSTLGMFGSGYIEMLARQMTFDLLAQRNALAPGQEVDLVAKGVSFGTLRRGADGSWDTSDVEGLAPGAVKSSGPGNPPSLIIAPFHQVGAVVSLRQFTNNAMNHHHGIQPSERFGDGTDPDGDGFVDEMSRAEITAVSMYQALLQVPGRVISRDPAIEAAVWNGEQVFASIGCTSCHVEQLPLENWGWFYYEPSPFNPAGNLRPQDSDLLVVNLNDPELPQPRLAREGTTTWVPAYTDLKLHDITTGPDDPNCEVLNQHAAPGSDEFFGGNCRFLTKKLWGAANEPPFFHHGKFVTLRNAIFAHAGEAQATTDAFLALSEYDQNSVIEFLKSLQILPDGTASLVIDEKGQPREWPPGS